MHAPTRAHPRQVLHTSRTRYTLSHKHLLSLVCSLAGALSPFLAFDLSLSLSGIQGAASVAGKGKGGGLFLKNQIGLDQTGLD